MPDSHPSPTTTTVAADRRPAARDRRFIPSTAGRWPVHWRMPTSADLEHLEAGYRRGLVAAHVPLLHQPMPPLAVGSADAKQVAKRLYEAARREAEATQGQMVGLAAPQVGIPARACMFDPRRKPTGERPPVEQLRCVINPTLDAVGHDMTLDVDGCLSLGPIKGWVQRAARVRLRGFTPTGEPIDEEHAGLAARVLQHETDHLDGMLFPQRIPDDNNLLWASLEQLNQFIAYVQARRRGEKPPWNIRTPRDQWDAIRDGLAVFGSLADPTDGPE